MKGIWTFTLKDLEGKVIEKKVCNNEITYMGIGYMLDNAIGRANIADFNAGSTWIALGTGSQTFNSWHSGLGTEVSGTGNLGRQLTTSEIRSIFSAVISTTFGTTIGSGLLNEAGIFVKGYVSGNTLSQPTNAPNTGMLLNKVAMGTINKDNTNTLQVDVELRLND